MRICKSLFNKLLQSLHCANSLKSAYEKFISGASYIQLYTGMVYKGPNIVNKISEELYEILSSDGVKNIEEIIGSK